MNDSELDSKLGALRSVQHRHRRLNRVFYQLGRGVYRVMEEYESDFIDGLTISPVGNFQRNDGSEDEDQLLVPRFELHFLGVQYDFVFRSIPAGEATLIMGEISIRTRDPVDTEDYIELARLTFDERGDVVEGPKVVPLGKENITNKRYCTCLVALLIYNHVVIGKPLV